MSVPKAYRDTMLGRIDNEGKKVQLPELKMTEEQIKNIRNIQIIACGTAYHAGLVGRTVIEQLVRIPVETDVASEYRYRSPIVNKDTLVIVVSQSGETADTLAYCVKLNLTVHMYWRLQMLWAPRLLVMQTM